MGRVFERYCVPGMGPSREEAVAEGVDDADVDRWLAAAAERGIGDPV